MNHILDCLEFMLFTQVFLNGLHIQNKYLRVFKSVSKVHVILVSKTKLNKMKLMVWNMLYLFCLFTFFMLSANLIRPFPLLCRHMLLEDTTLGNMLKPVIFCLFIMSVPSKEPVFQLFSCQANLKGTIRYGFGTLLGWYSKL